MIKKSREQLGPLQTQMIEIRSGNDWNLANALLATKAAPTAELVMEQLTSMVDSQKELLSGDVKQVMSKASSLRTTIWVLLFAGVMIGGVVAVRTTRDRPPAARGDRVGRADRGRGVRDPRG